MAMFRWIFLYWFLLVWGSSPVTLTTVASTASDGPTTFSTSSGDGAGDDDISMSHATSASMSNADQLPTEAPASYLSVGGSSEGGGKIPLYLAVFFSLGGVWEGSGLIPAVTMALEDINHRADLLVDYELRMVWNDSRCDGGIANRILFDFLFQTPPKIMILGPACSPDSQAVSSTADKWNLITMSYSAASPELSNRVKYPFFYRTYFSDSALNPTRIRILKEFNWTRVATIHENTAIFAVAIDDLLTSLKREGITVLTSESFSEDPTNQVTNLKKQDARIILANMYKDSMRRVLCEAYLQGMTGEGYVWLIIGWYIEGWYLEEDPYLECSRDQIRAVVEGAFYIATEGSHVFTSSEPSISGYTTDTYTAEIKRRLTWPENSAYIFNQISPFAYDAAWAIALALNGSAEILKTKRFADGGLRRLEDFNYDDGEMSQLFLAQLNQTEFAGLTGPISFNNGDRVGVIAIEQLRRGCPADDQLLIDPWCLTFETDARGWSAAYDACVTSYGDDAILAPVTDINVTLDQLPLDSIPLGGTTISPGGNRWYVGFFVDAEGLGSTDRSLNHSQLAEISERITLSSPSSHQQGCIVLDVDSDSLVIVECDDEYPYVCARPSEYQEQAIGYHDTLKDDLQWISPINFAGSGAVPLDRTPEQIVTVEEIYRGIPQWIYILISLTAGAGIGFSLFLLAFNIKFRNHKFVKLSSPNINNIILLGGMLVYAWTFLYGLDSNLISQDTYNIICRFRHWFLSLGFVMGFGAMLSKTWRVYRVAAFVRTPKRRVIHDTELYRVVIVIVVFDLVILLAWVFVDPLEFTTRTLYEVDDPERALHRLLYYVEECQSLVQDNRLWFLTSLYGYKALLILCGTFFFWQTSKVRIPALNDSKLISISGYVFTLSPIAVVVSFLVDDPTIRYIIVCSVVIFCTTFTISVIFIPKVYTVYHDPLGKHAVSSNITRSTDASSHHESELAERHLSTHNETIQHYEEKVAKLNKELQTARDLLNKLGASDNTCGLNCYGLTCGCSHGNGCNAADKHTQEEQAASERFVVERELLAESSTNGSHPKDYDGCINAEEVKVACIDGDSKDDGLPTSCTDNTFSAENGNAFVNENFVMDSSPLHNACEVAPSPAVANSTTELATSTDNFPETLSSTVTATVHSFENRGASL